jgi:hypothetical protein
LRWGLLLVLLLGVLGRVAYVDRPLDHRLLAAWRQADYTQVARNFHRGDLDILYPQIDWRGDTPGYVEMEFPLVPWLGAALGRVAGYDEALVRLPSSVAAVAALLLFVWLCRRALPPTGAVFAVAAYAVHPLLVPLATSMQPESVMLLLCLLAMTLMWMWDEHPRRSTLFAAAVAVAAAILAKAPAAYLGLVLAYLVFRKQGRRAFAVPSNYAAAVVAIAPPLAWYAWAHQFWLLYGNSLGVSNESHFIGWDMLFPPRFLAGVLKWESRVFAHAGWLLALAAIVSQRGRAGLALPWYAAVWVFYLVAARTSGDDWAGYYHSLSAAPACLLMGAGVAALWDGRALPAPRFPSGGQRLAGLLVAGATLALLVRGTVGTIAGRDSNAVAQEMRRCVLQFQSHVPADGLIVVRGGRMLDEYGRRVAYNEPMVFAWMDRKGFNYAIEEQGAAILERIAARGGRFWIARAEELALVDLERSAETRYRRLAACGSYLLYDLRGL